ncbi:MAG: ATP synthase F0 subunit B [Deltaproteobacteria bacterium]|nr:ATP synthase F0 subunit B [Deltaproteobacteria bacterium]
MSQVLLALASERPLISFDGTLVLNIALWLLLFIVLRPLLWEPMVKLISAREGGTFGSRDDAKRLEREAKEKRDEFEAALKTARAAAATERDNIRARSILQESEILGVARSKVSEAVEAQRALIDAQRVTLRAELQTLIPAISRDVASKALGRELAS